MGVGRSPAAKALVSAQRTPAYINLVNLNEAFAAEALAITRERGFTESDFDRQPGYPRLAIRPRGSRRPRPCGSGRQIRPRIPFGEVDGVVIRFDISCSTRSPAPA